MQDDIGPDAVTAHLEVTTDLLGSEGALHPGVCSAVVETFAIVCAAVWLGDAGHVVGITNATDHVSARRPGCCAPGPSRWTGAQPTVTEPDQVTSIRGAPLLGGCSSNLASTTYFRTVRLPDESQ